MAVTTGTRERPALRRWSRTLRLRHPPMRVDDTLAIACITPGYDRTLAAWGAHLFG